VWALQASSTRYSRDEGWGRLYRGTSLVLVGVRNVALQFMAYEKMKSWKFERKRWRVAKLGRDDDKLVLLRPLREPDPT